MEERFNMIRRSYIFKRVCIIGVGFMGGSLGMAIKKNGLAKEVIGLSHKQSSLVQAIKNKAIDTGSTDLGKALKNVDCVILAAPVDSIIQLLTRINQYLKRHTIVTDIGSSKVEIVETATKVLSFPQQFIGSHPLVGSEKRGVSNSVDDLFANAQCVLTPTEITNRVVKEKIKFFWSKLDMDVQYLSPEEHDEALAYISHLPHIMAYGLMETLPKKFLNYSTQSLIDTTRIAKSSPQMWNDICMTNSKKIIKSLDEMVTTLSSIRQAIVKKDRKDLLQHFSKSKEKRDELKSKKE